VLNFFFSSMEYDHEKVGHGIASSPMGICASGHSPDRHLRPDRDGIDVRRETRLEEFSPLYRPHPVGQATSQFTLTTYFTLKFLLFFFFLN